MYHLTLYFKTASTKEDFFNFPKSDVTKQITQSLITNLTNKPSNIFHIYYLDSDKDQITLMTEDDYRNAKEYVFNQAKVAGVYVVTDQIIKFAFQEDYKSQLTIKQQKQGLEQLGQNLTRKEIMEIKKMEKRQNKKAKKQKEKEQKKNKNKPLASKSEVFQPKISKTMSRNFIQMEQKSKIENQHLDIFKVSPKVETPPERKEQSDPSVASTRRNFNLSKLELNYIQVPKCSSLSELKNSQKKLLKGEIKQIQGKQDICQQDSQYSFEFDAMPKKREGIDHKNLKQQIISQILALLPKYIKAECFKGRPEVERSLTDLLPACFNCKKHLNHKQLRKMQKRQAFEQKKKEIAALNQLANLFQQKHFETKK